MKPTPVIAIALFSLASPAQAETLTVYAPDYFASEWGPGPAIAAAFEATCGCEVDYVTGDLLPRLRLEGARTRADVVIGLGNDELEAARATGLFAPSGVSLQGLTMPIAWDDDTFVPFDWSHLAFVYDADVVTDPPASFRDLVEGHDDLRIAIQDPRTSVSGLGLALWIDAVFGDGAEAAWAGLAPKVVTVTQDWSASYGLFTAGEADMVLSYATSPAYHAIAEGDDTIRAAIFPEGHYVTVETAARVAGSDRPDLAQAFLDFVLTPDFQRLIPEGNWSMPARLDPSDLPPGFAALPLPDRALAYPPPEAEARRDAVVAAFEAGLGR